MSHVTLHCDSTIEKPLQLGRWADRGEVVACVAGQRLGRRTARQRRQEKERQACLACPLLQKTNEMENWKQETEDGKPISWLVFHFRFSVSCFSFDFLPARFQLCRGRASAAWSCLNDALRGRRLNDTA